MLTDPRPTLAKGSELVNGLLGLVGLAGTVRALAGDDPPRESPASADDFVHLLLSVVSLGEAAAGCAGPAADPTPPGPPAPSREPPDGWLR